MRPTYLRDKKPAWNFSGSSSVGDPIVSLSTDSYP